VARLARFLALLSIALPFSIAVIALFPVKISVPLLDARSRGGWLAFAFLHGGSVGFTCFKPLPKPANDQPLLQKEEVYFSRGGFSLFSGEFAEIGPTNIKRFERRFEIAAPRWLLWIAAIGAGVWSIRRAQRVARFDRGFSVVTTADEEPGGKRYTNREPIW
jgi:hypothetical protein